MNTNEIMDNKVLTSLDELNKRLGVVISILLRGIPKEKSSVTLKDQVSLLNDLGLRPKDIAGILGKTQKHVGKELVGIRKIKIKKTFEK